MHYIFILSVQNIVYQKGEQNKCSILPLYMLHPPVSNVIVCIRFSSRKSSLPKMQTSPYTSLSFTNYLFHFRKGKEKNET